MSGFLRAGHQWFVLRRCDVVFHRGGGAVSVRWRALRFSARFDIGVADKGPIRYGHVEGEIRLRRRCVSTLRVDRVGVVDIAHIFVPHTAL